MSGCEGSNSDSIVTTEVGVGMSTRQRQDLLTNALSTLRTDIVTIIDSKLQAVTENITAKIRQENEKLSEKLTIYTMKLRNCLVILVVCEMALNVSFKKSHQL